MMNQTLTPSMGMPNKSILFGTRLKSAREALGMNSKDAADALRLQESIIITMESGEYKNNIPMMFMRGYIRSYSKLLGIPDSELQEVMEIMNPKPQISQDEKTTASAVSSKTKRHTIIHSSNWLMRLFTCLLAITLIGLMGIWWHNHKTNPAQNQTTIIEKMPEASTLASTNITTMTTLQNPLSAVKSSVPQNMTNKVSPNKPGKDIVGQLMNTLNSPMQFLLILILFLVILTVSMRLYSSPAMASAPGKRSKRQLKSSPGLSNFFKLRAKPLLVFLTAGILLTGVGSLLLKHQSSKHLIAGRTNVITKQSAQVADSTEEPATSDIDSLLMTTLEAFMPTPTLNSLVLINYQPYALQDMQMTLDNYLTDAAATKFALTDKSMPIGQFVGKKSRRHKPVYYYEEEETDSPPPYYQEN